MPPLSHNLLRGPVRACLSINTLVAVAAVLRQSTRRGKSGESGTIFGERGHALLAKPPTQAATCSGYHSLGSFESHFAPARDRMELCFPFPLQRDEPHCNSDHWAPGPASAVSVGDGGTPPTAAGLLHKQDPDQTLSEGINQE